jgi:hypothetical protein
MTVSGVPSTPSVGYGYGSGYYNEENQMCMADGGESYTVPFTLETPLPVSAAPPNPPPVRIDLGDPLECSVAARFGEGFGEGAVTVAKAPLAVGGCNPLGRAINEEDAGFDMVEAEVPDVLVDTDGDDLPDQPDQPEIHPDADADADTDEGINPDADADADTEILPDVDADGDDIPDVIEDEVEPEDYVDIPDEGEVPVCVPYTIFDTDFTTGTPSGVVASGGSISSPEDSSVLTHGYDGNVLPPAAGWSPGGAFVSPPTVSGGILSESTLGSDGAGYYQYNTTGIFDNVRGTVVDARIQVPSQDDTSSGAGFSFEVADGRRLITFDFYGDRICDANTGECTTILIPTVDTTSYHTYRVGFAGNDYKLYVDGELGIDGTGDSMTGAGGINHVLFGDIYPLPDSSANIDYVDWYGGDDTIPCLAPVTYVQDSTTGTINTGIADYNHSGTSIGWNPTSSTAVSASVRASNNCLDLSSAAWVGLSGNPAVVLGTVAGQCLQWMLTFSGCATVDEVSGGNTCP